MELDGSRLIARNMLRPPALKTIVREVVLSLEFLGSFYFGRDFSLTKYRNNNFSVKSNKRWLMCEPVFTYAGKSYFLNSAKWCLLSSKRPGWVYTLSKIRLDECRAEAVIGLLLATLVSIDCSSEWFESKKLFYVK